MSKTFSVLLVVLMATLSAVALATPPYKIRRQLPSGNGTGTDQDSICAGSSPTMVSTSSVVVGNATLELTTFSCAMTPSTPFVSAHKSDDPFLAWLEGLLWWLFPDFPPVGSNPKKTTTTTKTTTSKTTTTKTATTTKTTTSKATTTKTVTDKTTSTKTVTSVSVSASTTTATDTATVTDVSTATIATTETEVSTATSATTVVGTLTETETDTETETVSATATVTQTVSASSPTSTATDVCGEICTTVCGEFGQLPPTTEDCQQLVNSITILNGQIAPEFTVQSNHVQTISFGTCRFFFENVSPQPLTFCWLSMVQDASAAASACLPPNQPVLSEGLCISNDGLWEVGVAHS